MEGYVVQPISPMHRTDTIEILGGDAFDCMNHLRNRLISD